MDVDSFSGNVYGLDALLEMESRGTTSILDLGLRDFLDGALSLKPLDGEGTHKVRSAASVVF